MPFYNELYADEFALGIYYKRLGKEFIENMLDSVRPVVDSLEDVAKPDSKMHHVKAQYFIGKFIHESQSAFSSLEEPVNNFDSFVSVMMSVMISVEKVLTEIKGE